MSQGGGVLVESFTTSCPSFPKFWKCQANGPWRKLTSVQGVLRPADLRRQHTEAETLVRVEGESCSETTQL